MTKAQPVTFTFESDRLNSVAGFTAYSDCAVDMNDDHLDDVVRVGNKGIYIDYQQPDSSFTQRFFPLTIQSPPSWSICAGDIDNNGYNDLMFGNTTSVSFVQASADGRSFEEKVMPSFIFSQRSTMFDINNDGWLDGFMTNDTAQSMPYRNLGFGEMIEDTNLIHTSKRPGNYAAIWTDYDNDSHTDLYITKCQPQALPGNINRTNLMYRNNGDGTFSEVGAQIGLDDNAQSWSTVFEDFDNDGDFDAFIVNHDFQNRLFRNNGDGSFTDVIVGSGINANDLGAYENSSGDFNNDGYMDIFAELENEIYLGNGDLTFTGQDAPTKKGAIADLNNDGFLDLFHNNQLWMNDGNTNHWLKIVPLGIEGNRNGIGTRVEIYGTWGKQIRELRSGQSYSPMHSLIVHFGLGQSDHIDSIIIRWPSGITTTLENLSADTLIVIPEAECLLPESEAIFNGATNICPGDTTQLLAPSGFANYLWSNGNAGPSLMVDHDGSFFVISTDSAGCVSLSSSIDIKVIQENPPVILSPKGNTICEGDSLILNASAGDNYKWSTGENGVSSITVSESGIYTVSTDAICFPGQLTSSPFEVVVLPSPPPVASGAVILPGDSILLMAECENCEWYDQAVGGNLLATGEFFQTMPLSSSVTYYVESHYLYPGEIQSGGKPDTTGNGGKELQAGYLLFETWEPFTLLSVTVYVPEGGALGTRFVQLWSGDSLLAFKSFVVVPGTNFLELNFQVPVGKFSLQCQQGNLWRNTAPLDYPYAIGDAGRITTSSFGDEYYYFFYDWKIKKEDFECISDRTAVDVILSGTEESDHDKSISIFPNPTTGILYVEIKGNTGSLKSIKLLDPIGQELLKQELDYSHSFQLDLNMLPSGMYSLQIFGDNLFEVRKLIKN